MNRTHLVSASPAAPIAPAAQATGAARPVSVLDPRAMRLLVPLAYGLLTVVMLWPLVRAIGVGVADTNGDPLLNAWALRWVQHALVTNPAHLYDGNTFAPNVRTLAFSEALLPQAIMAWPLSLVTHDPLVSYNLSVLLTYPFCATAMYALCRTLGANRGGSFLAGLLFAFAPFRLDNNSHLQVLSMQWMPLALLAVIRFQQRPGWWRGLAVAAAFALAALSSVYFAVIFGTGFAVFLAVEAWRQRRGLTWRLALILVGSLALAVAVLVPLSIPYFQMQREQGVTRTLDEAYDDAAHTLSYLTVTPGSVAWSHLLPTSGPEHSPLFPGLLLLVLAVVGLPALRRPWFGGLGALGLVGFVLSFGPTLGAKEVGMPMPYRLLYTYVPGYQGMRGPDRFTVLVLLTLCPLAAFGVTRLWTTIMARRGALMRYGLALTALGAGIALLDDAARLAPIVPVDRAATTLAPYRWLAAQPDADTGVVAEFPAEVMGPLTSFYSAYHWHPVLWGQSGVPEPTYRLRQRFAPRDAPGPADLDLLADMGVRTLVLHRAAYAPDDLQGYEDALAAVPNRVVALGRIGDSDVYRLMPTPDAPPTLTATFAVNPLGNVDRLTGQIILTNDGRHDRIVFAAAKPRLVAEVRRTDGGVVSREPLPVRLPVILPPGGLSYPFSLSLPAQTGDYTVTLVTEQLTATARVPVTPLHVIGLNDLPHLTLTDHRVTGPALFAANETISLWVTLKDGKTVPLRDVLARNDGTLSVTVPDLPANAARVVAYGKTSGIELWVAAPP